MRLNGLTLDKVARTGAVAVACVGGYVALLGGDVPPVGVLVLAAFLGLSSSMVAIGLILVYRANRVISFAQGEIGAAPAMLAVMLMKLEDWPYPIALAVTIVSAALLGFIVEVVVIRRFARAPRLVLMIATIGVSLLLAIFQLLIPNLFGVSLTGFGRRTMDASPPRTPFSSLTFDIGLVRFTGDVVVLVVVAVLAVVGLTLFFRRSTVGVAIRASADNSDRARLMGISVGRLSTVVWMLAAVLSGVALFLQATVTGVRIGAAVGPTALIYAIAAAILARMESFPRALLAGMGIGVLTHSLYYVHNDPYLPSAVMVPVILIALLAQRRTLSRGEDSGMADHKQAQEFRPVPPELNRLPEIVWGRVVLGVAVLAVVVVLPLGLDVGRQSLASTILIYGIACVSLVILTGWSGQISLGQWGLAGVGAFVAGWLGAHHGADFFVSLLVAGGAGAVASLLIGLPALRIRGLFLAATTLAFAIAVKVYLLSPTYFGSFLPDVSHTIERPRLYGRFSIGGPLPYYYLSLGALLAALASARVLRRTRAGRAMIASRDNTRGAQSYGINVARIKIAAFAISGFWAALAGALFVYHQGALDQASFDPSVSVLLMTIVVIGGVTSLSGAMLGATYLGVLQYGGFGPQVQALATGLGVLILLMIAPGGVAQGFYAVRDGALRIIAKRHGLLVPSLVADRRVATLAEARAGVVRDIQEGTIDSTIGTSGLDVRIEESPTVTVETVAS